MDLNDISKITEDLPFEPVFISVSGAHLYGFESYNSDLDLRGCHLPVDKEFLRYSQLKDTYERMWEQSPYFNAELDIVSHSLLKFIHLLTKQPNGYILEQLFSPLIVKTSSLHSDLKNLAQHTFCKELKYHFGGFFKNQEKLSKNNQVKEVKLVLYQLRIIASSVYLAKTGKIQSNLLLANQEVGIFDQQKLVELVEIKRNGEKNNFPEPSLKDYWFSELKSKEHKIFESFEQSKLPNFDPQKVRQEADKLLDKCVDIVFKMD